MSALPELSQLKNSLAVYLKPSDLARIEEAYHFSDEAHQGRVARQPRHESDLDGVHEKSPRKTAGAACWITASAGCAAGRAGILCVPYSL